MHASITNTLTHLNNLIKYRIYCPFTIFCTQFELIAQYAGEGIFRCVMAVVLAVGAGWGGGVAAEEH